MSQTVSDLDDDFEELLDQAESEASGQWEEQFVEDMRSRFDEYGPRMFISDKQVEILQRIAKA